MTSPAKAAGPLGRAVTTGTRFAVGANALVLLRRIAFINDRGEQPDKVESVLLRWAADQSLGQDSRLIAQVGARRAKSIEELTASGNTDWQGLQVSPQWRLAVGLGNRSNPYEIGLSLHGTYGWPVIPGSTLKGMTCAWALECGEAETHRQLFDEVFGLPRIRGRDHPTDTAGAKIPARRGAVTFLDAIPVGGRVEITRDVVTPHVQPYYRANDKQPPGEYHNPIPSEFLVVSGGQFAIDMVGPTEHVCAAARWCRGALDELGAGGKTSAGYGYLTVTSTEASQ